MIRIIKIDGLVFQNIEPKHIDENGQTVWNIPSDPIVLKTALYDTLGWLTSQNIVNTIGDANKKDASTSKAVVLLAKLISTLNPDVTTFTVNEQAAYQKMLDLATTGYSDSALLNQTFDTLNTQLQWYAQKSAELAALNTLDELVVFAEGL